MGVLTVLAALAKWALTPIGSLVSVLVVMFVAWQSSGVLGEKRGAAKTVAKIEKATEAVNDKARKARDAAGGPGATDRLYKGYCRDC